jgi:hypothetical protein
LNKEELPQQWEVSVIVPIHGKVDETVVIIEDFVTMKEL